MKYFNSFLGSILLDEKIQIGIEEESILIYILEDDKLAKYNKNELSIILVKEENAEKIYSLNEKYNEWKNKNKLNIESIKKNNYTTIKNDVWIRESSYGLILFDKRIQKNLNENEVLLYVNRFKNIENYDKNEIREDIKKNSKKEINSNEKKQLIINYNNYIINKKNVEDNHKKNLKYFNLPSASIKFVKKQKFRVSNCWCCGTKIDNKINFECTSCGWILCNCGACGCGYYENIKIEEEKKANERIKEEQKKEEERIKEEQKKEEERKKIFEKAKERMKEEQKKEEERKKIFEKENEIKIKLEKENKINSFYQQNKSLYGNIYYIKNYSFENIVIFYNNEIKINKFKNFKNENDIIINYKDNNNIFKTIIINLKTKTEYIIKVNTFINKLEENYNKKILCTEFNIAISDKLNKLLIEKNGIYEINFNEKKLLMKCYNKNKNEYQIEILII